VGASGPLYDTFFVFCSFETRVRKATFGWEAGDAAAHTIRDSLNPMGA